MPQPRMRLAPPAKLISLLLGAAHSAGGPRASLLPIELPQGAFEIGDQFRVRPLARCRARDDYIIHSRPRLMRQYLGCDRAQPPLGAVAHHRIADLAAGGETNPHVAALMICRL